MASSTCRCSRTLPAEGGAEAGGTGTHGAFYIIKPGKNEAKILSHAVLDGRCFGTPSVYNGKIYVQTTKKLYCFGKAGKSRGLAKTPKAKRWPKAGKATRLQIVPSESYSPPARRSLSAPANSTPMVFLSRRWPARR